jgi:RHS repeat-associated protein
MQSASSAVLPQPPLAAKPQLREKPHQGLPSKNPASHQGPSVCKFTVSLGLRATVVENGVQQIYSARYYNPTTGRFMSRDPEDGKPWDPKTLHKFLYAGGDPVNTKDPTGRESILEEGAIDHDFILETLPTVIEYACTVEFAWGLVAESTNLVAEILTWNKEYEPVWTPPRPLTVLCGWKEFGGGGSGGGGSE